MYKEKLTQLVSELEEEKPQMNPEQQALFDSLEHHIHMWDEPEPIDDTIMDYLEVLLIEAENEHPKAHMILSSIANQLSAIGI